RSEEAERLLAELRLPRLRHEPSGDLRRQRQAVDHAPPAEGRGESDGGERVEPVPLDAVDPALERMAAREEGFDRAVIVGLELRAVREIERTAAHGVARPIVSATTMKLLK